MTEHAIRPHDLDDETDDQFDDDLEDQDDDEEFLDDDDDDEDEFTDQESTDEELPDEEAGEVVGEAAVQEVRSRWRAYLETVKDRKLTRKQKLSKFVSISFLPEYRIRTGMTVAVLLAIAMIWLATGFAATAPVVQGQDTPPSELPTLTPGVTDTFVPTLESQEVGNGEAGGGPVDVATQVLGSEAGGARPAVHIVQQGENLFRIALRYGVDLHQLAAFNGIADPNRIYINQVINIPAGMMPVGGGEPSLVTNQNVVFEQPTGRVAAGERCGAVGQMGTMNGNLYCIDQGDTLFGLSQRFNVSMDTLMAANPHITNPNDISLGSWLAVP